jgi:hypothetical protein
VAQKEERGGGNESDKARSLEVSKSRPDFGRRRKASIRFVCGKSSFSWVELSPFLGIRHDYHLQVFHYSLFHDEGAFWLSGSGSGSGYSKFAQTPVHVFVSVAFALNCSDKFPVSAR